MRIIIILIFLSSCTTLRKAEHYFQKHPTKANNVARNYIINNQIDGVKICIDAFPQIDIVDSFIVSKDSIIINTITDSIFSWLTEVKYVDRERIKKVLIPCKDSIRIINRTIYDKKYEILYNDMYIKYNNVSDSHAKIKKILFWTWFWIILFAIGIYGFYKTKK
jgi:hypothetical protein